jgi:2-keto-3-deoxy-L-rhamnonate aldolase RhmA
VWPINPDGELLLGLKIENPRALANVDQTLAVPGIGFAEWGPGDNGMALGDPEAHDPPYSPTMAAIRERVKGACSAHDVFFLDLMTPDDIEARIDEGVMIGGAPTAEVAERARAYARTKRS